MRKVRDHWGDRDFLESMARLLTRLWPTTWSFGPGLFRCRRLAVSPMTAADFVRMAIEIDITGVLGSIRVPTLVLHRRARGPESQYVADRIPRATVVELAGAGELPYSDDVADAVLSFMRGDVLPAVPTPC